MRVDELALGSAVAGNLGREIDGLDALETPAVHRRPRAQRWWGSTWPKLAAVTVATAGWQMVVWSGWRPEYALAGPKPVLAELWRLSTTGELGAALRITLGRAITGYLLAVVIGAAIGLAVARIPMLRTAVGSLLGGLQSMPSIAWFPLAILMFGGGEGAIFFVVVLGAAPAIANGIISGVDQVPPLQIRAGRMLGAQGLPLLLHVIVPAALPGVLSGLKQGWAFAWRSLMAGELLVIVAGHRSIGVLLQTSRDISDVVMLEAVMIAILVIGVLVDSMVFGAAERAVLRRRGLLAPLP
jgi:NitT/TauT family transport system permease protein